MQQFAFLWPQLQNRENVNFWKWRLVDGSVDSLDSTGPGQDKMKRHKLLRIDPQKLRICFFKNSGAIFLNSTTKKTKLK